VSPVVLVIVLAMGIAIGALVTSLVYGAERERLLARIVELEDQLELAGPIVDAMAPPVADQATG